MAGTKLAKIPAPKSVWDEFAGLAFQLGWFKYNMMEGVGESPRSSVGCRAHDDDDN